MTKLEEYQAKAFDSGLTIAEVVYAELGATSFICVTEGRLVEPVVDIFRNIELLIEELT